MNQSMGMIFDMDGVLVHSNPVHKKAIDIFCEKYDKSVSEEYLRDKVYGTTNQQWLPRVFGDISDERVEELADEKESLFRKLFDPGENMVSGIIEFLERAAARNIKLAVATSAPKENEDYILKQLGIKDYFEVVLNSSHVTHSKPHPEIYQKAIHKLGLGPEHCVVFEDSVAGVEAGRSAGCKTIGVTTTHTAEEMTHCDLVIDNFVDLQVDDVLKLLEG